MRYRDKTSLKVKQFTELPTRRSSTSGAMIRMQGLTEDTQWNNMCQRSFSREIHMECYMIQNLLRQSWRGWRWRSWTSLRRNSVDSVLLNGERWQFVVKVDEKILFHLVVDGFLWSPPPLRRKVHDFKSVNNVTSSCHVDACLAHIVDSWHFSSACSHEVLAILPEVVPCARR